MQTSVDLGSMLPKLPSLPEVISVLSDSTRQPQIAELYKCIFSLRQQTDMASQAVEALIHSLAAFPPAPSVSCADLRSSSVLFRHECCYLLGQIGADSKDVENVKKPVFLALLRVLEDEREDEVTRHEAAEGIAAVFNHNLDDAVFDFEAFDRQLLAFSKYGVAEDLTHDNMHDQQGLPPSVSNRHGEMEAPAEGDSTTRLFLWRNRRLIAILGSFVANLGRSPLGETCYVALAGLKRQRAKVCACQYLSFDPAIGDPTAQPSDIARYTRILADAEGELYARYVAMFTLRNLHAVRQLAQVLSSDTSSAALRHEIAFILGQIEFSSENTGGVDGAEGGDVENVAVTALVANLCNEDEHEMVRHESAIALGSIGGDAAKQALKRFASCPVQMVAESCVVALDTMAYWDAWETAERLVNGA